MKRTSEKLSLTVVLDLPPKELSPNFRCHWAAKSKAKAAHRLHTKEQCVLAAVAADWPVGKALSEPVVKVAHYNGRNVKIDRDNILASLKAAFDGLTDAGIWPDDCDVTYLAVVREVDRENPRVELIISE